jgi:SAM-dependent methyltransferase
MLGRVALRTRATAEIVVPAVPALVPHYVDVLADGFAALGRPFSNEELAALARTLHEKAQEGFQKSPYSTLVIRYHTANDGTLRIDYGIAAASTSLAEAYQHWIETREPPLFGKSPDARLLTALDQLAVPTSAAVLDIGAGTGRNTLPLARRGHEVFAVEPAPALADALETELAREGLAARVVRADVLTGPLPVPRGSCAFALASQVTSHFRSPADLRALLQALAEALAPGGHALISMFMPFGGYVPDRVARELSQTCWSTLFTRDDLTSALEGQPLRLVSDEDALAFERAHQPPDQWPPTGWYEPWARGEDVFGPQSTPPVMLRWLLFRRT